MEPKNGKTCLGRIFDAVVSPRLQSFLFPEVQVLRHLDYGANKQVGDFPDSLNPK
jgi:hypothetical protein